MDDGVGRGRDAFDRQAWRGAYEHLSAASREKPLEVEDLERLASAAYLAGHGEESSDVWAQAHKEYSRIGEIARAARCAFWLAFTLLNNGESARGGGWVDRGQRLLDDRKLECVERGYLRYAASLRAVLSGDAVTALTGFREAVGIAERYRDPELSALAMIGHGRCLIFMGEINDGVALLDEAMVAVGAREVSPIATGDAYCTVIEGCHELFDFGRAQEWTSALSEWCEAQPELVLYRGECLIHRAEIMFLHGTWTGALRELEQALARLSDPAGQRTLGSASYLRGELHRLRGEFEEAEASFRMAHEAGRQPQPGVALLRLAQGRVDVADATIRRSLGESDDPLTRGRLLGAFVEIVLAAGDVDAARVAADELAVLATDLHQPFLRAHAEHVTGEVLLAEQDPSGALVSLRRAWKAWSDIDMPHEAARARVAIALACRALGDDEGAEMELDAARQVFAALGATPDLSWADSVSMTSDGALPGGLTRREVEVLALVAQGKTNREVANTLVISEKTVASHLSHMFTKLGLSSRAAATAYAYENGLTDRSPDM
jgi:DNA-binding NarL/FixJ family response regulator